VAGLTSAIAGIASAAYAKRQAVAGERQAKAAEEQTEETKKQTGIAKENLDVAKEALAVAENPPAPAPTTGGIVVNNTPGGSLDEQIPEMAVAEGGKAKGAIRDTAVTLLKVSQGPNNFAMFNATVRYDGKNIAGGSLQDGPARGYLGGSTASNLSLYMKPQKGPILPYVPEKGKPYNVASVLFRISGNNVAPRTKAAGTSEIQRFGGNVSVNAAGVLTVDQRFFAEPGTKKQGEGKTMDDPVLSVDLPPTGPAPIPQPAPTPAPGPGKNGGGAPAPGGGGK
jgi:hypothetical protein